MYSKDENSGHPFMAVAQTAQGWGQSFCIAIYCSHDPVSDPGQAIQTKSHFGHVTIFWHFTVCFELRSARKFWSHIAFKV